MITPAFALTATERVLPKLALDFTTASLDARVTITRAGNTATRVNSSGVIETVNANLPRFDYDPIAKTCKGLLVEEARVNNAQYSEDFSASPTYTASNASVSTDATTSPSNTSTADALIEDTATSEHAITQTITYAANNTVTTSVFAKANGRDFRLLMSDLTTGISRATFNLTNGTVYAGTVVANGSWTNVSASIQNYGNGWYRCILTATKGAGTSFSTVITLYNGTTTSYAGNGSSGVYLWGLQAETGAFVTSYIPNLTTGTTTRNADIAEMTGTNFSDWYTASQGAFVYQGFASPQSTAAYMAVNDGSTANSFYFDNDSGNIRNVVFSGGGVSAAMSTGTIGTANAALKIAGAYKVDDFAAVKNNGTLAQDLAGAVPVAPNSLLIGSLGVIASAAVNNCVAKIFYYPQRLTNAEIQTLSK